MSDAKTQSVSFVPPINPQTQPVGKKILFVEDEDLVARMYQTSLQHSGFQVVIARDGEEGIEKCKSEKPDIVITDIMMPKMNGIQMLDLLKSDETTKLIPVVVLSNLSGEYDKNMAMKKGGVGYWVKKDMPPKTLEIEVKKILGME